MTLAGGSKMMMGVKVGHVTHLAGAFTGAFLVFLLHKLTEESGKS